MFEFEGLTLRPVEERDLGSLLWLRSDPRVWMHLGDPRMIDSVREKDWFEAMRQDPHRQYYVLAANMIPFLGIVRMDEIDWVNRSIRVGGDICPEHWHNGYGKTMLRLILKYVFDILNMHRAWLLVLDHHGGARALYEKVGFVVEGVQREAVFRDGEYHDYVLMSVLEDEWRSDF